MKATPLFRADLEEYPELGKLINASVRHIITLMEIHDIGAVRRYRKDGVFERPYVKDVVTPLDVPGVPRSVAAARNAAGTAILDLLEATGIEGLSLEATKEEIASVAGLWEPKTAPAPAPAPAPVPVPKGKPGKVKAPVKPGQPAVKAPVKKPETKPEQKPERSK